MPNPIRVLVVDDSAFARKVLRESLERHTDLEVVGIAHDGLDALEKIPELRPDVLTLDLVMPHLDGLGVLRALQSRERPPRVVVISTAESESEQVLAALEAGAIDFVHKPTALATDRLYEIAQTVAEKVRTAAAAHPRPFTSERLSEKVAIAKPAVPASECVVVLGTSTGGPQALARLLSAMPGDFPCPMAIVLHIPVGFTEALARRLNDQCALEVVEGHPEIELVPGRVVLARAGQHLRLVGEGHRCRGVMDLQPFGTPHRPSVDVLFQSAAEVLGERAIGVVLTGMGNDGLAGARAIRAAGGRVVTEAASSAVIYGMPRVVSEAGLSTAEWDLEHMASHLMHMVSA